MEEIKSQWKLIEGSHFHEKLRSLKFVIKSWTKGKYRDLKNRINTLEQVQDKADEENWEDIRKMEIREKLDQLYEARSSGLKQKAILNLGKHGDRNSRFYHACVMRRRKRNQIIGISHYGTRFTNQSNIKKILYDHFHDFFGTREREREPIFELGSIKTSHLTQEASSELENKFSMEEILIALKGMESQKSRSG